jgi:hypothetical protein
MVESISRFLGITVSILILTFLGVPPGGLLLVGLIGGFLSVPWGDSNKFLSPIFTISVTNGILWFITNNQINSGPYPGYMGPGSGYSREQRQEQLRFIISGLNDPPSSNWFENWELFVVMMVVGSVIGFVVQNQNPPETVFYPHDEDRTIPFEYLWTRLPVIETYQYGRPKIEGILSDGKLEGPFQENSFWGPRVRGSYQEGLLHGPYSEYQSETRKLLVSGHYNGGNKTGVWFESGVLRDYHGTQSTWSPSVPPPSGWSPPKRIVERPQTESSSPSPSPDPEPQVDSSPTDSLQSLTDMKNEGLITEEEFQSKKKELLDRL